MAIVTVNLMLRSIALVAPLALLAGALPGEPQYQPAVGIAELRKSRQELLRTKELSPLSLVHREYFGERKRLTIGSAAEAGLRLPDASVAPIYAVIELENAKPVLRPENAARAAAAKNASRPVEIDLSKQPSFRVGSFALNFRAGGLAQGAAVDVYDTNGEAKKQFRGLDFFPVDAAFTVRAQMTPLATPQKITLTDSQGFERPYWIYGRLSFRVNGTDLRLEVYAPTLDRAEIARDGFMLIFGDATNGKETYKAGRYLHIEGKLDGPVAVDFNRAYNPPCNFSPAFTCPFPRRQNRLSIPIRAGEKKYTGPAPQLLKSK